MFLRKMAIAVFPLLMCAIACILFRLTDDLLGSASFWSFILKGLLIGAVLALIFPVAGIRTYTNGLTDWMFVGAALLTAVIIYQLLENDRVLHSQILSTALPYNGQVLLAEAAVMSFMLLTAILHHSRSSKPRKKE